MHKVHAMQAKTSCYSNTSSHCHWASTIQSYSPDGALICPIYHMVFWDHMSLPPKQHLSQFSCFCQVTRVTNNHLITFIRCSPYASHLTPNLHRKWHLNWFVHFWGAHGRDKHTERQIMLHLDICSISVYHNASQSPKLQKHTSWTKAKTVSSILHNNTCNCCNREVSLYGANL